MNQESRICEKELALERLHQGLKMLGLAVDALPEICLRKKKLWQNITSAKLRGCSD